jgi:hypothetical protein
MLFGLKFNNSMDGIVIDMNVKTRYFEIKKLLLLQKRVSSWG